ncbi:hypothetical protein PVPCR_1405480 [Plasmodium vinckei petteri]|uniref:Uncharacterized protein n=1 Tax=Plasmodium vinckei petteri TaxID=138298 RepID=A0A6V7THT8_PLAVN|nr:hypothetical protein PVPCR_1405480 [Plasmodium vinckei petteri]
MRTKLLNTYTNEVNYFCNYSNKSMTKYTHMYIILGGGGGKGNSMKFNMNVHNLTNFIYGSVMSLQKKFSNPIDRNIVNINGINW